VTEIRGEERDIPGRKGWGEEVGRGDDSMEDTSGENEHKRAE